MCLTKCFEGESSLTCIKKKKKKNKKKKLRFHTQSTSLYNRCFYTKFPVFQNILFSTENVVCRDSKPQMQKRIGICVNVG